MIRHNTFNCPRLAAVALFAAICFPVASPSTGTHDHFQEGCCVNPEIKRPKLVSDTTVSVRVLTEALNCATNNIYFGNSTRLATELRGHDSLNVSYFYGKYMPEQEKEMLSIAAYSEDGRTGYLFDVESDNGKYYLANLPQLRRRKKQWQVGEINGGEWSYTRLWNLAQEIGTRRRERVTVSEILAARPERCTAMNE